jgi:low molecular weight phosphotyrosine protein phosphatase
MLQHGVPISCTARQLSALDFTRFTHILAADKNNLQDLLRKKPSNATADVRLWGSYLDNKPISDPYYGGMVCCFTSVY